MRPVKKKEDIMSHYSLDRGFFLGWDNWARAEVIAYAAWCVGIDVKQIAVEIDAAGLIVALSVDALTFPTFASIIDIYRHSSGIRYSAMIRGQTVAGEAAKTVLHDGAAVARAEILAAARLESVAYHDGEVESVAVTLACRDVVSGAADES